MCVNRSSFLKAVFGGALVAVGLRPKPRPEEEPYLWKPSPEDTSILIDSMHQGAPGGETYYYWQLHPDKTTGRVTIRLSGCDE